ncbi:SDR family NAD(P)-dependent oxidoreductase (plasmid) [Arthrobacter sp. Z1-9]
MSEMRFDDRVVIVTGGGRGIGRAHARMLGSRGAHVVVNDLGAAPDGTSSSEGPAAEVVEEIRKAGGSAVANTASVATREGAESIVQLAIDEFGKVDAVINNAGIVVSKAFEETPEEDFRRTMEVSYFGTLYMSLAALPHMRSAGYGRIVNTSSAGLTGFPGVIAYGGSKAALLGLTLGLAAELKDTDTNITVNALVPVAASRLVDDTFPEDEREAIYRKLAPEFVSAGALYLAHEDNTVSGEFFSLGGGRASRWILKETAGFFDPELSPESFRDNLGLIREDTGLQPATVAQQMQNAYDQVGRTKS